MAWGWYRDHRDLVDNTLSLVGTAAATSGLGFVFWWLAARLFAADTIGLASAAISAMLLLSTLGVIGLDALVIGELPRARDQAGRLVATTVLAAFVASSSLGWAFAWAAPAFADNLAQFFAHPSVKLAFGLGVGLTGATYVFDRATVGLLRGGIQFRRNVWFAVLKLALLPALLLSAWLVERADAAIYVLWAGTTLASFLLVLRGTVRIAGLGNLRPAWSLLRRLRREAWRHHLLNVAQHGPGLAMPVVVVSLFAAEVAAAFYVTWMLVTFAQVVPVHLTVVLHAVGVRDPEQLSMKLRATLRLSLLAAVAAGIAFALLADPLLRLFGPGYAEAAAGPMRLLALTVFPLALKVHYFALARIHGFTARAALVGAAAGAFELLAAGAGGTLGTLHTMSACLLAALVVEAAFLLPTVARYARAATPSAAPRPSNSSR